MNAPASLTSLRAQGRKIWGLFLPRWLKFLACLAAGVLHGFDRAATTPATSVPAANSTTATAAPAKAAPPTMSPPASAAPVTSAPVSASDMAALLVKLGKRNARVHDPSTIVKCKDEYWVFATSSGVNGGVTSWHSKDLVQWAAGPSILTDSPQWVWDDVPNNNGGFWAPDVMYFHGRYLLYYAASSWGVRDSGIGLATNPTLDPADPAYKWTDQGVVIETRQNRDQFNAIDPAIFADTDGKLWLAFGSFWEGIKLVELDPATGRRLAPDSPIYSLAHKSEIEASYIYHHGDYYYLFVDWGFCCRGVNSTYNIRIGRSKKVTGPYLDKDGVDMMQGGGTLFLGTEGPFIGPGHAGIIQVDDQYWFSCHFYDGSTPRGTSYLGIRPMHWDDTGWPAIDAAPAANPAPVSSPAPSA
jgi:arabinan endo-1,5-alpha-L-arabinosidase